MISNIHNSHLTTPTLFLSLSLPRGTSPHPALCCPPQASRDLVCFLQLDHVNVYYGQDYRSKYKAPTDYCLALKVRNSNGSTMAFCFGV